MMEGVPAHARRAAHVEPFKGPTAADRFAAMDFDATDGLSVDEMGIDYGWPEPGEECLDVLATAQLYWPLETPTAVRRS